MKLKIAVITLSAFYMFASTSIAQTTSVAYVDIDRVTEKSERLNKAMNNVSSRVEGIQKEIEAKRKRLVDIKSELKKGDGILASSEIKKKQEESSKLEKDLIDLEHEGRLELRKLDTTTFEPMIKTIVLAIQDVAKEKKIDLVLRGEAVIYGTDAADITDAVVKKLNSPSYNPDLSGSRDDSKADSKSDAKSDSKDSSDSSESSDSKSDSSESKEASSSDESAKTENDSEKSIIPSIPLRTRPVDRQQD